MTKRYSILQKKLRELEAQIDNVLSLPSDSPCHQLHYEDIEQRLAFVKGLLSAEIASHPSKPHHLSHMSQRLKELESAFLHWETSTLTSVLDHVDEQASTCSCTESCLNDDGDAQNVEGGSEDSVVQEEMELPVVVLGSDHGLVEEEEEEEKKGEEDSKMNGEVDEFERDGKREERGRQGGVGRLCGAVAIGVVIGMVASMGLVIMVITLSQGCFQYGQHGNFLTPT